VAGHEGPRSSVKSQLIRCQGKRRFKGKGSSKDGWGQGGREFFFSSSTGHDLIYALSPPTSSTSSAGRFGLSQSEFHSSKQTFFRWESPLPFPPSPNPAWRNRLEACLGEPLRSAAAKAPHRLAPLRDGRCAPTAAPGSAHVCWAWSTENFLSYQAAPQGATTSAPTDAGLGFPGLKARKRFTWCVCAWPRCGGPIQELAVRSTGVAGSHRTIRALAKIIPLDCCAQDARGSVKSQGLGAGACLLTQEGIWPDFQSQGISPASCSGPCTSSTVTATGAARFPGLKQPARGTEARNGGRRAAVSVVRDGAKRWTHRPEEKEPPRHSSARQRRNWFSGPRLGLRGSHTRPAELVVTMWPPGRAREAGEQGTGLAAAFSKAGSIALHAAGGPVGHWTATAASKGLGGSLGAGAFLRLQAGF